VNGLLFLAKVDAEQGDGDQVCNDNQPVDPEAQTDFGF
jgi:hypothetical protein